MGEALDRSTTDLVANVLLTAASGWALSKSTKLPFASAGLGLLFCKGVSGVINAGISDDTLAKVDETLAYMSQAFSVPLLATQIAVDGKVDPPALAILNLAVPTVDVFGKYVLDTSIEPAIIKAGKLSSAVCIAYFSYLIKQVFGYGLACTDIVAEFGHKGEPKPELYNALMALCCVFYGCFVMGKTTI